MGVPNRGLRCAGTHVALGRVGGGFAPVAQVNLDFGKSAAAGDWAGQDRSSRLLADVNGDGLADIIGFGEAGVYVTLADGFDVIVP